MVNDELVIEEYWIAHEDVLHELAIKLHVTQAMLAFEMKKARDLDAELVIYKIKGKWHQVFVARHISVEYAIKNLIGPYHR